MVSYFKPATTLNSGKGSIRKHEGNELQIALATELLVQMPST